MTEPIPPFEAIQEFNDHPSLKGEPRQTIYFAEFAGERYFCLADGYFLRRIQLIELSYANMGEPFRVLARLSFSFDTSKTDLIKIDLESAARLLIFCRSRSIDLKISDGLQQERRFVNYYEELTDPD